MDELLAQLGDRIGGNFAVSLAVALRSQGIARPAAILSISPWYDMELKNETIETNSMNDRLLSRGVLEWFREAWLGGTDVAWNDPRVNPLYADLTGLPPIQVYYGDYELFAGEATQFAKQAHTAGADVTLCSVPQGQHNFILGAGRVPEVDEPIEQMGQWLQVKLGGPVSSS